LSRVTSRSSAAFRPRSVDTAIRIAQQCGLPIRIAAKIDAADQEYFEREIEPLFALPHVEYIGEIADHQKAEFLSGAHALLFPIDWPEPFGLVMIEAMSCGTPVIAFNRGAVPEVVDEGVSGFIVEDDQRGGRRQSAAPAAAHPRAPALRGALHVAPDGAAVRRRLPVADTRAEAARASRSSTRRPDRPDAPMKTAMSALDIAVCTSPARGRGRRSVRSSAS
jgi:hypothetical protein